MRDEARAVALIVLALAGSAFVLAPVATQPPPSLEAPAKPKPAVPVHGDPAPTPRAKPAPVAKTKPTARPKGKAKAKPRPKAKPKTSQVPSCAEMKRERAKMTWGEQLAAAGKATPAQIAAGRRCFGL